MKSLTATDYDFRLMQRGKNLMLFSDGTAGVSIGSGYSATVAPANGLLVEGNVGIGTTVPTTAKFVVEGTQQDAIQSVIDFGAKNAAGEQKSLFLRMNAGIPAAILRTGGAGTDARLSLGAGSDTEVLTVATTGNVGIGTTGPNDKLHIAGTGNTGLTIEGGAGGTPQIKLYQTTTPRGYFYYSPEDGGVLKINEDGNNANGITLKSGNVGIGTTSPSNKLGLFGGGITIDSNGNANELILVRNNTVNNLTATISIQTPGAAQQLRIDAINPNTGAGVPLVLQTSGGLVGINTTTPQNILNVVGDINSTGTIYAQNTKNLSIGYDYALNGTIGNSQWQGNWTNFTTLYANDVTNASTRGYALNDSLWTLNYSDYLTTKTYAGNDTLWTANYSTYLTKPTWANVVNGTNVALVTAANTFGAYNQTFDTNTLFIDSVSDRVGIGTTSPGAKLDVGGNVYAGSAESRFWYGTYVDPHSGTGYAIKVGAGGIAVNGQSIFNSNVGIGTATPQNTLNIVGDTNSTGTIYAQNTKNLSIGYDYALNGTIGNSQWQGNWTNFTALYANDVTNASTRGYALNDSLWTLNYSDYLTTKTYAGNDTLWTANYSTYLTKPTWANIANGTMASWTNIVNGTMLSYAQALNNTLMQQANWNATNSSYFDLNKANVAGAFNQTFDTSTLFIDSVSDRVGIGTMSPGYKLDVYNSAGTADISVAGNNNANVYINRSDVNGGAYLKYYTGSTQDWIVGTQSAQTWWTLRNASSTSIVTVLQGGNVGIGTTSPEQKLEVLGLNSAPGASGSTPDGILRLHPTSSNAIVDMGMLTSPAYGWIQPRDRTNFATNYNLVLNPNGGNVGIGTTTPQNTLNVAGDINSTGTIYAQNTKNLSIGYDYALNGTIGNSQWQGNWTNFTALYANDVTNASTRGYALNDSLWTLNYSDYLTTKTYAGNDTLWTANYSTYLTKPTWANIANGTMASWTNIVNGTMLSYAQALNNTLMQQANWNATNSSYFDLNKANAAGAFNQTFDTITLFIDSVSDRVGIGTTSPGAKLTVAGGDIRVDRGQFIGAYSAEHANTGTTNTDFGSNSATALTGMRIITTWDGTYNDEEIVFRTHNGGDNVGEFGCGLAGKCGRDYPCRIDPLGSELGMQDAGQPMGFSATGTGADKGQFRVHAWSSHPARCRHSL